MPPFAIMNSTPLKMVHEIILSSSINIKLYFKFSCSCIVQSDYKEKKINFHVLPFTAIFGTSIMSLYSLFSFAGYIITLSQWLQWNLKPGHWRTLQFSRKQGAHQDLLLQLHIEDSGLFFFFFLNALKFLVSLVALILSLNRCAKLFFKEFLQNIIVTPNS